MTKVYLPTIDTSGHGPSPRMSDPPRDAVTHGAWSAEGVRRPESTRVAARARGAKRPGDRTATPRACRIRPPTHARPPGLRPRACRPATPDGVPGRLARARPGRGAGQLREREREEEEGQVEEDENACGDEQEPLEEAPRAAPSRAGRDGGSECLHGMDLRGSASVSLHDGGSAKRSASAAHPRWPEGATRCPLHPLRAARQGPGDRRAVAGVRPRIGVGTAHLAAAPKTVPRYRGEPAHRRGDERGCARVPRPPAAAASTQLARAIRRLWISCPHAFQVSLRFSAV